MQNLSIIKYNKQRVVTTKQIAEAYGTNQQNVSKQFNRNKEKFTEGKHYHLLKGEALKEFCNRQNDEYKISSKARTLYLWTERGALLIAKSINTDIAWEAYERLVDFYFEQKEAKTEELQSKMELPKKTYQTSSSLIPKNPSWYERNRRRMEKLCNRHNVSRKSLYHHILLRLGEEYDLKVANRIYEEELGYPPKYAIDIVSYFPQLAELADDYLSRLEKLDKE